MYDSTFLRISLECNMPSAAAWAYWKPAVENTLIAKASGSGLRPANSSVALESYIGSKPDFTVMNYVNSVRVCEVMVYGQPNFPRAFELSAL